MSLLNNIKALFTKCFFLLVNKKCETLYTNKYEKGCYGCVVESDKPTSKSKQDHYNVGVLCFEYFNEKDYFPIIESNSLTLQLFGDFNSIGHPLGIWLRSVELLKKNQNNPKTYALLVKSQEWWIQNISAFNKDDIRMRKGYLLQHEIFDVTQSNGKPLLIINSKNTFIEYLSELQPETWQHMMNFFSIWAFAENQSTSQTQRNQMRMARQLIGLGLHDILDEAWEKAANE